MDFNQRACVVLGIFRVSPQIPELPPFAVTEFTHNRRNRAFDQSLPRIRSGSPIGDICNTPRKGKLEQINGITRPNRKVAKSTAITPCDLLDLRSLWEIIFQIYLSEGYCKYPHDWAWRKGLRYGTILCDLVTHRVVDLLPDRESDSVVTWLVAHPQVTVVSRDRGTGYADAIKRGAPQAIQVADRWHLLENLFDAVEQVLGQHRAALTINTTPGEPGPLVPAVVVPINLPTNKRALGQLRSRESRYALYEQTLALRDQGENLITIARKLEMSTTTVTKYLKAGHFPERKAQPVGSKALRPYTAYLDQRWAEGCHVAKQEVSGKFLHFTTVRRGYEPRLILFEGVDRTAVDAGSGQKGWCKLVPENTYQNYSSGTC